MGRNVYLGKRVRDIDGKGLTHASEVKAIMRAILRDYRKGRISAKKARGRLLLLYHLVRKTSALKRNLAASTRRRLLASIRRAIIAFKKSADNHWLITSVGENTAILHRLLKSKST